MWPNFPKLFQWVAHVRGCPPTMTRLSPLVFCMWWFVVMPRCLKCSNWWGWHMLLGRLTNSYAESINDLKINVQGISATISPLLLRGKTTNSQWCLPCDCCWCWKCNPWTAKCLCVWTKTPTRCDQTFLNHSHGWHMLGDAHQQWQDCHHWCLACDGLWWCHDAWNEATGGAGTCSSADQPIPMQIRRMSWKSMFKASEPQLVHFCWGLKTTNSQWCLPYDCC